MVMVVVLAGLNVKKIEKPSRSLPVQAKKSFFYLHTFFCEEEDFSNGQIFGRVYRSGIESLRREKTLASFPFIYLLVFFFIYQHFSIYFLFRRGLVGQLFCYSVSDYCIPTVKLH